MKKKELYKFLKKESKKLSPEVYIAFPKEFGIPDWADEEAMETGKKIEPFWHRVKVQYPVNHYRRLKQCWKDGGWQEVVGYFNKRGWEILNKKSRII